MNKCRESFFVANLLRFYFFKIKQFLLQLNYRFKNCEASSCMQYYRKRAIGSVLQEGNMQGNASYSTSENNFYACDDWNISSKHELLYNSFTSRLDVCEDEIYKKIQLMLNYHLKSLLCVHCLISTICEVNIKLKTSAWLHKLCSINTQYQTLH